MSKGFPVVRQSGDGPITTGRVRIRARHTRSTDESDLRSYSKRIHSILGWIDRFNNDDLTADELHRIKLSVNLLVNELSLLHAALAIGDYKVVEEMLRLGANPLLAVPKEGTAIEFARKLLSDEGNKRLLCDEALHMDKILDRMRSSVDSTI